MSVTFAEIRFQQTYAEEVEHQHPKDYQRCPALAHPAMRQSQNQHYAHQRKDESHPHGTQAGVAGLR